MGILHAPSTTFGRSSISEPLILVWDPWLSFWQLHTLHQLFEIRSIDNLTWNIFFLALPADHNIHQPDPSSNEPLSATMAREPKEILKMVSVTTVGCRKNLVEAIWNFYTYRAAWNVTIHVWKQSNLNSELIVVRICHIILSSFVWGVLTWACGCTPVPLSCILSTENNIFWSSNIQ
jgi:hypothetical protein